jgi:HlyD family secretion protein
MILAYRRVLLAASMLFAVIGPVGCDDDPPANRFQGYVEAEFVDVAAGVAGTLDVLKADRGDRVTAGTLLFELDETPQAAAVGEAKAQLAQAKATLEDLKKGRRPSEIQSLEAQLEQAKVALSLAERELGRISQLRKTGAATPDQVDSAETEYNLARQRVAQQSADLETAQLGARSDQIAAAEATIKAREAMLAHAEWELDQTRQTASASGEIFDVLFREGEWVPAGKPVLVLLPPKFVKVRAFVPQSVVSTIHIDDKARVSADGLKQPLEGTVSFISPKAEYTPPVIYSRESRAKLVFMVEIVFDPKIAATQHPGQPVDVVFVGRR